MFWCPPPSRKPTPSEYVVLVVFGALVFIVLGVVALVVGFKAPAQKHELAVVLERLGGLSLGFGLAIAIGFWVFLRLKD